MGYVLCRRHMGDKGPSPPAEHCCHKKNVALFLSLVRQSDFILFRAEPGISFPRTEHTPLSAPITGEISVVEGFVNAYLDTHTVRHGCVSVSIVM